MESQLDILRLNVINQMDTEDQLKADIRHVAKTWGEQLKERQLGHNTLVKSIVIERIGNEDKETVLHIGHKP